MPWYYRHPTGRPPHPDVLTPAEWRVLEYVREGRSNAEIAGEIGVSINPVRTHVSSMLSKLSLRDRGELAGWRGEPAEVSRAALGRFGRFGLGIPVSWLGRGVAGAGLVAAGMLFVVAMQGLGGGAGGEGAAPISTVSIPPEPGETASATASATATTPGPAATSMFPALTLGSPIALPEGLVLYTWDGCTSCDGPPYALNRVERVGGSIETRVLFERRGSGPYILGGRIDGDVHYIFECSTGYCGGAGEPSDDPTVTLYRSLDDGETWESLGTQPLDPDMWWADLQLEDWGVGEPSDPKAMAVEVGHGIFEVQGVTIDLTALDPRGLQSPLWPNYALVTSSINVSPGGRIAIEWRVRLPFNEVPQYLSVFEPDGTHIASYEVQWGGPWVDEHHFIVTVAFGYEPFPILPGLTIDERQQAWIPSLVDIRDGQIRPIMEPFAENPYNRNTIMSIRSQ